MPVGDSAWIGSDPGARGQAGEGENCTSQRDDGTDGQGQPAAAHERNSSGAGQHDACRSAGARRDTKGATERPEDRVQGGRRHMLAGHRGSHAVLVSGRETLPNTATPRAPPTCRATALEADPTPASPWGTDAHDRVRRSGQEQPGAKADQKHAWARWPIGRRDVEAAEICHSPPAIAAKASGDGELDTDGADSERRQAQR